MRLHGHTVYSKYTRQCGRSIHICISLSFLIKSSRRDRWNLFLHRLPPTLPPAQENGYRKYLPTQSFPPRYRRICLRFRFVNNIFGSVFSPPYKRRAPAPTTCENFRVIRSLKLAAARDSILCRMRNARHFPRLILLIWWAGGEGVVRKKLL